MNSKKELEKDIEDRFVTKAARNGWWSIKFKDPSRADAPDQMVLTGNGHVCFIEFKRPGEKPRPNQLDYHKQLCDQGYDVAVCEGVRRAIDFVHASIESYKKQAIVGKCIHKRSEFIPATVNTSCKKVYMTYTRELRGPRCRYCGRELVEAS